MSERKFLIAVNCSNQVYFLLLEMLLPKEVYNCSTEADLIGGMNKIQGVLLIANLGLVDLDLGCSTVCPIVLGQMRIWQSWLDNEAIDCGIS